jgi:WD40 repeat protein/tRNA A-37 threonylcarbamoyl transferase component Bud32
MTEETIFTAALEKSALAERAAFLDEACYGDAALRQRVEALLRSHTEGGSFLETPAVQRAAEVLAGPSPANTQGQRPGADKDGNAFDFLTLSPKVGCLGCLGHYEVNEVIGRGGMGVVLKAFDEKLHRVVAIKVLAPQLAASATARQRFTREARAAAAVRNEHVIDIHAVEEANGLPYLVMEYVAGPSLQERLDQSGPLELKEILRLGIQIAAGLAAAHALGLVHRDIKPSNILLENGVERVKLTDFGLARAVDDASITQSGLIAGTPQYMAPEQAEGKAVGHRADLFSLGSVLYALCTGRTPFRASGTLAVLKRVAEDTPRPIQEINPEVPGWLVEIIARLHAKEPAQRFQSAAEVAELLSKHLAHLQQPALVTMPERMLCVPQARGRQRPTRQRWAVVAAALVVLLVGLSVTEATGVTRVAATVIRILTPDGILVVEVEDPQVKVTIKGDGGLVITGAGPQEVRLRPGSYRFQASRDGKPIKSEVVTISRGERQVIRVSLERASPNQARSAFVFKSPPSGPLDRLDPDLIPAAERFPWQPPELVAVLGAHRQRHWGQVLSVAWSPDGKSIASSGTDFVIRIWDAATMRECAVLRGATADVRKVVFAADGRRLLSADGNRALRLWDVETRKELGRVQVEAQVRGLALSADGRYALSGHEDKTLRLWDVATLKELRRFDGHTGPVSRAAFSPDGRRALSGGFDNTVRLWELATGKEVRRLEGHTGLVSGVAFSPDGRFALSANSCQISNSPAPDYQLRLWDLETGKALRFFAGHTKPVVDAALSPDGRRAVSCSTDGTIRSWEVATGKEMARFEGHAGPVACVAFSPDGRRAVSGGEDGTVRLWDTATGKEVRPVTGPVGQAFKVTISADGGQVLVAGGDRLVRVWDVARGKETGRFQGHTDPVLNLALSPDGRRALSASAVFEWHVPQPDNGDRTGPWRLWDVATGKELRRLSAPPEGGGVAFSPDGRRTLTGCGEQVVLWDVESGRKLRSLDGHAEFVNSVAFSPDGRRALSGSWDRTVRLWDIGSGTELRCFKGHTGVVRRVACSPDGRHAVSGSEDGTVRLWDLAADQSPGRVFFTWHTGWVTAVMFGPAGKTVASAGTDGRIIVWDVAAGDKLREWHLPGPVWDIAFAADGRHLAAANGNGTAYLLRLAKP